MTYYLIYIFRNFNTTVKLKKKVQLEFVITIIST